jgi:hypothetical protein
MGRFRVCVWGGRWVGVDGGGGMLWVGWKVGKWVGSGSVRIVCGSIRCRVSVDGGGGESKNDTRTYTHKSSQQAGNTHPQIPFLSHESDPTPKHHQPINPNIQKQSTSRTHRRSVEANSAASISRATRSCRPSTLLTSVCTCRSRITAARVVCVSCCVRVGVWGVNG